MNPSDAIQSEGLCEPIRVYRSVFSFSIVMLGFLFFLVMVLLDLVGVTALGWFTHLPWLGYGFLVFLLLGTAWLGRILLALREPVLEITADEVRLTNVAWPSRRTVLRQTQIVEAFAQWQPDTVPAFVVFDVNSLETSQRNSGVWNRVQGTLAYFECSNLSLNAVEIVRRIQTQISCSHAAENASP